MRSKSLLAGVAALAAGLIFVTGGGAATMTTVTLTVNSTADSSTACTVVNHKSTGTCTLRGAVLYASTLNHDNTLYIVKLAAKTYHLTLGTLGVSAETVNTGNIVQFVGATAGKKHLPASIIDGSGNPKPSSVFVIDSPTQMANVVIKGGSGNGNYTCDSGIAGCGGGIFLSSALDLQNSVVRNNTACSAWTGNTCTGNYEWGGGIYMASTGVTELLTLYKTTVTHNTAGYGGGIYNDDTHHSTALIMYSHLNANTACTSFSNHVCIGSGDGGGFNNEGEQVVFEHSTVNGNTAGSPAYNSGDGGGIYTDNDNTQLNHTVVSNNVAGYEGGGIDASDDNVDIVYSTISHNIAGVQGGGLYIDFLASFKNSTFSSNTAGGTFACTIVGGTTTCQRTIGAKAGTCAALYPAATSCQNVDGLGGGIMSDYEYPMFIATTVTNNTAVSIKGDATNCAGGKGGGIWTSWSMTALENTKFTNNTADCGGGIFNNYEGGVSTYTFALSNTLVATNTALEDGGGIWTSGAGTGTLYSTHVIGNHAGRQTGGIWDDGLGSVLFGGGNVVQQNTSVGACKNVTWPCK